MSATKPSSCHPLSFCVASQAERAAGIAHAHEPVLLAMGFMAGSAANADAPIGQRVQLDAGATGRATGCEIRIGDGAIECTGGVRREGRDTIVHHITGIADADRVIGRQVGSTGGDLVAAQNSGVIGEGPDQGRAGLTAIKTSSTSITTYMAPVSIPPRFPT